MIAGTYHRATSFLTLRDWNIDPTHSEVNFKVKHLVVSTVTGHFDSFEATIESSQEDFSDATIAFEANIASVNTKNEQRDGHLKSADFFDAANYPKMSFVSTSVKKFSEHELRVVGNLTFRGVKREVALDVIYNSIVSGFGGTTVAGFEITGKLNRFDFSLQWNGLIEVGGVVVSNEVKLEILAECTKVMGAQKAA